MHKLALDLDDLMVETFDAAPLPGADPVMALAAGASAYSGCRDCDTERFVCGTDPV